MKSAFFAFFLIFYVALAPITASAASLSSFGGRYFVQTTKAFWRNAFDARNIFEGGFTTDLSDFQLRVARFAGLKTIPVKKFNILETENVTVVTALSSPLLTAGPVQSVSWGVRAILGGSTPDSIAGGDGVTIAILDTGADVTHPDLASRIAKCTDYADRSKPVVKDSCADRSGHGTHMAGIVAADGGPDGNGIIGVAPHADLLVYRVCNADGLCMSDDIAVALRDAVDSGANIIVLGMGGDGESSFVADALAYAADHDALVIAAAGNDGPYDDSVDWPARNATAVAVGALAGDGTVADFSSRGSVEFVAPGVNIESTFRDGGYAILSGTSMAAPHVAGLAARVWQKDAKHPARATRELLREMAVDIAPDGDDDDSGWGMPTLK